MNKNVKIAKELVKLAKMMIAGRYQGTFSVKNEKVMISIDGKDVNSFVKEADYKQMESWFLNCEGGTRDFSKKGDKAVAEFVIPKNSADVKNHAGEIKNNLKSLGLEEE